MANPAESWGLKVNMVIVCLVIVIVIVCLVIVIVCQGEHYECVSCTLGMERQPSQRLPLLVWTMSTNSPSPLKWFPMKTSLIGYLHPKLSFKLGMNYSAQSSIYSS